MNLECPNVRFKLLCIKFVITIYASNADRIGLFAYSTCDI